MTNIVHQGGCQCGFIRFRANGAPRLVANCHCNSCRKATGAAFATFVDFARGSVEFSTAPNTYASSHHAERLFCKQCGTPLAYQGDASPDEINIYIGAFDELHLFEPTQECHLETALWKKTK